MKDHHYHTEALHTTAALAAMVRQHHMTAEQQNALYELIQMYKRQYLEAQAQGHTDPEIMMGFYQAMDTLQTQIPEYYRSRISCKKGCAHCCYIRVDVSKAEALTILQYCRENGIAIDWDKVQRKAQETKAPCPFLGSENECTIYAARPVSCRKYFVLNPPEDCDTINNPNGQTHNYINVDMEVIGTALFNVDRDFFTLEEALLKFKTEDQ